MITAHDDAYESLAASYLGSWSTPPFGVDDGIYVLTEARDMAMRQRDHFLAQRDHARDIAATLEDQLARIRALVTGSDNGLVLYQSAGLLIDAINGLLDEAVSES